MRFFLTGATGFIGSHVARLALAEGCTATALVRPGANLRRLGDLRELQGEIEVRRSDFLAIYDGDRLALRLALTTRGENADRDRGENAILHLNAPLNH